MTLTAATFIPMSYSVFAFLRRIQLSSVNVVPALMPSICVCTAPATPIVHKSLLLPLLNCGDIALGGGDFTVVSIFPSVIILLLVVLSVTIVSAFARLINPKTKQQISKFFIIDSLSKQIHTYLLYIKLIICSYKYLVSWIEIFHTNKILTVTIICTKIRYKILTV